MAIFSILTKKCKNHTFFWSPPPNGHFSKNVQKKLLASNTVQKSGPKNVKNWVFKGVTIWIFAKNDLFSKTPHIDKNKKISQNWSIAKTKNECLEFVPNTKFSHFQIFYPMCRKFVPNLSRGLISGLKRFVSVPG